LPISDPNNIRLHEDCVFFSELRVFIHIDLGKVLRWVHLREDFRSISINRR